MKYRYERRVRVADTDASGVIYFANIQMIAMEAFEEFLHARDVRLHGIFQEGDFLLPVVHAEADYLAPVYVGDEIAVALHLMHIGNSSFSLAYEMLNKTTQTLVAKVQITHVVVSSKDNKAFSVPSALKNLLKELSEHTA